MSYLVEGAGLGLRRDFMDDVLANPDSVTDVGFFEVAPENWMNIGGGRGKAFRRFTERHHMVCHGLSLSIGGPAPLDTDFVRRLGEFLDTHDISVYTEHLSYCGDFGQLYDLMPIPFTADAVHYVADRIGIVQDILGRRIGMENVSTYAMPTGEMSEIEFLNAVVSESGCGLHLDINNIFVNASNHGFDPLTYLASVPGERIMYAHVAGHLEEEGLRIDTHGEDVLPAVWDLLDAAYTQWGAFPTLLERDFNIPSLDALLNEVRRIGAAQARAEGGRDRVSVA